MPSVRDSRKGRGTPVSSNPAGTSEVYGFSERLVQIATAAIEEITHNPGIPHFEKLAAFTRISEKSHGAAILEYNNRHRSGE